jgi:hypothetical protein
VKEALFPKDGSPVEGTKFTFRWSPPAPGDAGQTIADYHIQVCDRQDMRWPLSPNFDKLISRTASAGKAEWSVPSAGLLNPETTYYWRVRARDGRGLWGPWSQAFRLTCAGPGVPANLKLVMQGGAPVAIVWEDNPEGRKAVSWRVYGSNEQGFTASDGQYVVRMGGGFCQTMQQFKAKTKDDPFFGDVKTPSNLVAGVKQRRLDLSGPLYAFYRVAAVDEKGIASGASDYVELPRPFIWTAPAVQAKVAQPYRYRPAATFSIGHLTCRGGYNAAFWQREQLAWTLQAAPKWLSVQDGELVGRPAEDDAGAADVILKVVNSKDDSAEQRFRLVVEK